MTVIFSKTSEKQLLEIAKFIALDNPVRAISFVNELVDKALEIDKNPYIYPLLRSNNSVRDYSKLLK